MVKRRSPGDDGHHGVSGCRGEARVRDTRELLFRFDPELAEDEQAAQLYRSLERRFPDEVARAREGRGSASN